MSVAKALKHDEAQRRRKRGSVNNTKRLDAFRKGVGAASADWGTCEPRKLLGVVEAITNLGGAVTFGLSRDQGAHSVTIMLDGERETLWFNGNADLDEALDQVTGLLESLV